MRLEILRSPLLIGAALLTFAVRAEAQCSQLDSFEEDVAARITSGTCQGNNVHELEGERRRWRGRAKTCCNASCWKSQVWNFGAYFDLLVSGECGNAPANTSPVCPGIIQGPNDMGFDSGGVQMYRLSGTSATWGGSGCVVGPATFSDGDSFSEGCTDGTCCGTGLESECRSQAQGEWNAGACTCNSQPSPIIIDLGNDGFDLSDASQGVLFDMTADGVKDRVAWPTAGGNDAFLALDRNGNAVIDDVTELFGNKTDQPVSGSSNGFEALKIFDLNKDGLISAADPIYTDLLLWIDTNHDGASSPSELLRLDEAGVRSISVKYRELRRQDRYGNVFRFASRVDGSAGPFAYDVYVVIAWPEAQSAR